MFSFGANGEGQLGVGDTTDHHTPQCIEDLPETKYKMLAAGTDHSMVLTGRRINVQVTLVRINMKFEG